MSPPFAGISGPDPHPVFLDGRDPPPERRWLWHGYIAPANLTLLVGPWKGGKTALVAALLARMATGGTLAGLPVRAGRAVVVSEEAVEHWAGRVSAGLRFADVGFFCRPFRGLPTPEGWEALIDRLLDLHADRPIDLVVIDPLASFLPARTENNAACVLAALAPLQRLTKAGIAVLVLHHPRKEESAPGRAARGSGALTGFADVLIEMDYVAPPDADDRRRKLAAFSRHAETTRRLAIERTADGTDYVALGDFADPDSTDRWPVLRGVLEDAGGPLTVRAIRAEWPEDYPCPSQPTLWRWLDAAVRDGRVTRAGPGTRNQPFVYGLPG